MSNFSAPAARLALLQILLGIPFFHHWRKRPEDSPWSRLLLLLGCS